MQWWNEFLPRWEVAKNMWNLFRHLEQTLRSRCRVKKFSCGCNKRRCFRVVAGSDKALEGIPNYTARSNKCWGILIGLLNVLLWKIFYKYKKKRVESSEGHVWRRAVFIFIRFLFAGLRHRFFLGILKLFSSVRWLEKMFLRRDGMWKELN